jgi:hypothetical protein
MREDPLARAGGSAWAGARIRLAGRTTQQENFRRDGKAHEPALACFLQ